MHPGPGHPLQRLPSALPGLAPQAADQVQDLAPALHRAMEEEGVRALYRASTDEKDRILAAAQEGDAHVGALAASHRHDCSSILPP